MNGMITQVPGFQVGHVSDFKSLTGCTVILCPPGTIGSVDVRGSATGTRQLDALTNYHIVNDVQAVLLTGGSSFGLDAAGGVMEYLEEHGRGFDVTITRVPTVPTAVIFDLSLGDCRVRPDRTMGYNACLQARSDMVSEGSVGAGTGATVGKLFGLPQATKGGLGTTCLAGPEGLLVGALVAVNAFGDVLDYHTGKIIAGARSSPQSKEFVGMAQMIRQGVVRQNFGEPNTTLGVIATNARLTREQAHKIAQMGHNGLARAISPIHTLFDGDIVFALSNPQIEADLHVVGLLGEEALRLAIDRAIKSAHGLGVLPAYQDLTR
ncbi:MAG: P1 family peptidase [Deltaproteobacteria bacterium]|nr:P1 family peptidase [Deltaproteobacteria bacterium]MBW1952430.1 P1 family peptidase [Deltaproteobacteria bacterium]MBW1986674.1 P1 family peptidase [Deltaproteobacteria bacterium]MBW2134882.1 P1 family peptidase [Deltaproteobacteria bacterium]